MTGKYSFSTGKEPLEILLWNTASARVLLGYQNVKESADRSTPWGLWLSMVNVSQSFSRLCELSGQTCLHSRLHVEWIKLQLWELNVTVLTNIVLSTME